MSTSDDDMPMLEEISEIVETACGITEAGGGITEAAGGISEAVGGFTAATSLPSSSGWNDPPFVPMQLPVDRSTARRSLNRRAVFPIPGLIRDAAVPGPSSGQPSGSSGSSMQPQPARACSSRGPGPTRRASTCTVETDFVTLGPPPPPNKRYTPRSPPRASASCRTYDRDLCSPDERLTLIIETINGILSTLSDVEHVRQYMQEITINWNARSCNYEMQEYMICFARELSDGNLEEATRVVRALARDPDAAWFTMFSRAVIDVINENPRAPIHEKMRAK